MTEEKKIKVEFGKPEGAILRLPTGQTMTPSSVKAGIVSEVAAAFKQARKSGAYQNKDWILAASEKVVERMFNIDAFFAAVLRAQQKPKEEVKKP